MAPQEELVRVVRTPDGILRQGRTLPGRGAWLCAGSLDCLELARRRRAFDRALRASVSAEAVARLAAELGNAEGAGSKNGT